MQNVRNSEFSERELIKNSNEKRKRLIDANSKRVSHPQTKEKVNFVIMQFIQTSNGIIFTYTQHNVMYIP